MKERENEGEHSNKNSFESRLAIPTTSARVHSRLILHGREPSAPSRRNLVQRRKSAALCKAPRLTLHKARFQTRDSSATHARTQAHRVSLIDDISGGFDSSSDAAAAARR